MPTNVTNAQMFEAITAQGRSLAKINEAVSAIQLSLAKRLTPEEQRATHLSVQLFQQQLGTFKMEIGEARREISELKKWRAEQDKRSAESGVRLGIGAKVGMVALGSAGSGVVILLKHFLG